MESGMRIDIRNTATSCLISALDGISFCAAADLLISVEAIARIALPLSRQGRNYLRRKK
jgi:hypothetical protein